MDGPAFHEARRGIEIPKESGFLFHIATASENSLTVNLINNSIRLILQQVHSWNKNRLRILSMLQEGYDYKAISDELDISQQVFYKNAGSLDVIKDIGQNMATVINDNL